MSDAPSDPIKRLVICNVVLLVFLTSFDIVDFVLRLLMVNILYSRIKPDAPSLVSGWEKHFCEWLSKTVTKYSELAFNMPPLERIILIT
jgi:hypothetical protein